jgi:NADH dehydrogenase subunit M (EC 1.6.5.3)
VVTVPLIMLAIPSVLAGYLFIQPLLYGHFFGNSIFVNAAAHPAMRDLAEHWHGQIQMMIHSLSSMPLWLAIAGIATAYYGYMVNLRFPQAVRRMLGPIYTVLENNYFFDWFNQNVLASGMRLLGTGLWKAGCGSYRWSAGQRYGARGRVDGAGGTSAADRLHLLLRPGDDCRRGGVHGLFCSGQAVVRLVHPITAKRDTSMQSLPLLSLSIWIPIAFGVLLLFVQGEQRAAAARWLALIGSLISFLITLPLITGFDNAQAGMQFVESVPLDRPSTSITRWAFDGVSLWFVPLTALMTVIVIISAWEVIKDRVSLYLGAFLILSGLMIGVFAATDALLFYVFFEATLIPMYLIIGIWGGPRRVYAAFKFFLYTLAGSLLMLVALIYLYLQSGGSFDIANWYHVPLSMTAQIFIFIAFFFAFAVKIPMWPVHTWLPDAHVEAPTGGSVILAAIMLKLGAYGFIRFSLPCCLMPAMRSRRS